MKDYTIYVYEMSKNDRNGNQYHGMKVISEGKVIVSTGVEYKSSTEQIVRTEFLQVFATTDFKKDIKDPQHIAWEEYKKLVNGHLSVRSGLGYRELNREFKK